MFKKSILSLTFAGLLLSTTMPTHTFWGKKKTSWKSWFQKSKKPSLSDREKVVSGIMLSLMCVGYVTLISIAAKIAAKLTVRIGRKARSRRNANSFKNSKDKLKTLKDLIANLNNPIQSKGVTTSFENDFAPGTIHPNVQEIRESFEYLEPEEIPRTILLYGPTSTGKTHTAKALANDLGATEYIEITGPELRDKWEGESVKRIQSMFKKALEINQRTQNPAVIIINEIDGGTSNIHSIGSSGQSRHIAQAMQGLLDRDEYRNVFIIATSNFVEENDIPRPLVERFQEQIKVDLPNAEQRRSIIDFYAQKHNLDLGQEDYSQQTEGFNVRRLKNWVQKIRNRCKKEAHRRNPQTKKTKQIEKTHKPQICKKKNKKTFLGSVKNKFASLFNRLKNLFGKNKKKQPDKKDPKKPNVITKKVPKKIPRKKRGPKVKISKDMAKEELDKIISNNIELSKKKDGDKKINITQLIKNIQSQNTNARKTRKRSGSLPRSQDKRSRYKILS
ncbi:AAA family ATPase [Candidatus Dependentiae bacterium]